MSHNGTLSNRSVQASPHQADLELADSTEDGKVINLDILIGLDYCWSFVTGKVIIKERQGLQRFIYH